MPTDTSPEPSTAARTVEPLDAVQKYLVARLVYEREGAERARVRALRWRNESSDLASRGQQASAEMCQSWAAEHEADREEHSAEADRLWHELTGGQE